MSPCSVVERYEVSGGTYCVHLQWRWKWSQRAPSKLRYSYARLHSDTFQNTKMFICTATRTSNLTKFRFKISVFWYDIMYSGTNVLMLRNNTLLSSLGTLKIEAAGSTETSMTFYKITRHHIPWNSKVHFYRYGNFRSLKLPTFARNLLSCYSHVWIP